MNSVTMGRSSSSFMILTLHHAGQLCEAIHSTDDDAPVGVTLVQKNMIRQLNNTNPPHIVFRNNNPEDSPIDGIPGRRLEHNPGNTAALIPPLQSSDRTLRPLDEIANTAGKESEHRLVDSRVTHLSAPLLRFAATIKARRTNSPTHSGEIAMLFRLTCLALTVLPATTIRQVLPIVMMPPS
nr:MAG TPA: hypothetical protein [Caudoviricetes sp.]